MKTWYGGAPASQTLSQFQVATLKPLRTAYLGRATWSFIAELCVRPAACLSLIKLILLRPSVAVASDMIRLADARPCAT